jgi:putative ABC transport system permease protein
MLPERISGIWLRIKALFRRRRLERDLEDELEFHLAMRRQKLVEQGMPPEEARYAARRAFGDPTHAREYSRELWTFPFLESLAQDFRYGLRQLRRNPGFTAIAVLTLALGIGANTAIFSVVYGIVFRPLPYRDPGRLVGVWERWIEKPGDRIAVSLPNLKDWESQNSVFDGLAAYGYNRYDIRELEGGEGVRAAMVTPRFFPLLGVKPFLGRELGPADDRKRVVVLSYELWQRLYHGETDVIGRSLRLSDHECTVIGVMPSEFRLPTPDVEMWLSFAEIYSISGSAGVANWLTDRGLHGYRVLARLKKGVSIAQAQSQMDTIELRLAQSYPKDDKGLSVVLVPLQSQIVGDVKTPLVLLLGAVGLILLIACVNVANLMLARATIRERETTLRRALGASAGRLIRQILTEGALLGALGGGLGILLAFWGVAIFLRLGPKSLPRLPDVRVDGPVLLFAVGATVLSCLLFSLAPAFRALGSRLSQTLREGGRGAAGHARAFRTRGTLVACEIALATVLVTGAGLMLNSFLRLATLQPGFSADHLLTFDTIASLSRYRTPQEQTEFFNRILARVKALPGVKAAGACTSMPPDIVQEADTFQIQGVTPADPAKSPQAWYLPATPGFLRALGLPLIRGRDISSADTSTAPPVAVINLQVVKTYFPHEDPLGRKILFLGVRRTIVGVAGNTTYDGLGSPPDYQIYVPYAQATFPGLHFAVRTAGDPLSQVAAVRAAVQSVDSGSRAGRIATMEQLLSRSILQPRFYTWLLGAFGFVALALATVGILGVISYSVTQRTHEIGIRMALGAERRDVLKMVVGQGLRLALIGVAIGIAGALALTRFLASMLDGVRPTDPLTFIAVSLILMAVALLACYIPARRASKVDPMEALRYE